MYSSYNQFRIFLVALLITSPLAVALSDKNSWTAQHMQRTSQRTLPFRDQWSLGHDATYAAGSDKQDAVFCKSPFHYDNFAAWRQACDLLPHFTTKIMNPGKTVLTITLLEQEMERFLKTIHQQYDAIHWLDQKKPSYICGHFSGYTQKLILPSDAIVAVHGDVHGDIHALNRFISYCADQGYLDQQDAFKITDSQFYMLFLGDYVDRGWYGAEVMYTIMRLKNENPSNVFMVRGNHEDVGLNTRYGFAQELRTKFAGAFTADFEQKLDQFYSTLPMVLYIGTGSHHHHDIMQCCHGGIEIGFDPHPLLSDTHAHAGIVIEELNQQKQAKKFASPDFRSFDHYFRDKPVSYINGFMWNDFIVDPHIPFALSSRDGYGGSMFEYGRSVTTALLKYWSTSTYTLRAIFRAHQHSDPAMKDRILNTDKLSHPADAGVGKLWIGDTMHQQTPNRLDEVAVITFSVAPGTGYGYPIDAFGLLKMAPDYTDWRLEVIKLDF